MVEANICVSIVVPCYNQADYLGECIRSIRAQSFQQWEAIIVDDGSEESERVTDVVRRVGDSRIHLLRHERNRGLAAARNTGISESGSDCFVCVDADDCLATSYLASLLPVLQSDNTLDCVFADYVVFGAAAGVV